ncbi:TPA: DNAse, partial [Streptococcus pyogenes]|nr:DNAse [Streptococcus pyogenes]
YGVTSVTLDNVSPLAELDYQTGMMLDSTQNEEDSNVETEEFEEAA